MERKTFVAIFGILLVHFCSSLKKSQPENSLGGVYFSKVGTHNFLDTKDDIFLTSFTLTHLENVLSNAMSNKVNISESKMQILEENLNKIYKICKRNRKNYLPYEITEISSILLKTEVDKALNDSISILSDLTSLISKNYTEKFNIKKVLNITENFSFDRYLYPRYVSDFEIVKKFVEFKLDLVKISKKVVIIKVSVSIPIVLTIYLYKIYYVPRKNSFGKVEYLEDQSWKNLAITQDYIDEFNKVYFLVKNIENCHFINNTFLCKSSEIVKVQDRNHHCLPKQFYSDCNLEQNFDCRELDETCNFKSNISKSNEFTFIDENKIFVLVDREANFIYKCENTIEEQGVLKFVHQGNYPYSGIIEIEENCFLITAFSTIFIENGIVNIIEIENADLIYADFGKFNTNIILEVVFVLGIISALYVIWIIMKQRRIEMFL